MNLAKILTELRKSKGLSRQKLADEFGISVHTYIKYENGSVKPPYETLCSLADFYGVTTDYLLGRAPAPGPIKQLTGEQLEQKLVESYFKLPKEYREAFLESLRQAVMECRPD